MRELTALAWARFKIITAVIADAQGNIIAIAFYYTILVPFALGARLFSNPLHHNQPPQWLKPSPLEPDLESARRQG